MRVSSVMLPAVVLRHVEVGADEHALAGEVQVGHFEAQKTKKFVEVPGQQVLGRYFVVEGAFALLLDGGAIQAFDKYVGKEETSR